MNELQINRVYILRGSVKFCYNTQKIKKEEEIGKMNKKRGWNTQSILTSEEGSFHATMTVFIFVILSAAIGLGVFSYMQQEKKFSFLTSDVQSLKSKISRIEEEKKPINLTVPSVQKIDNVFLVAKLSTSKYLTGIKVKGRVINTSALEHNNVSFRITVQGKSREFIVKKITSGSSQKFEVDIPDVPLEKAQLARIKNLSSSVSYFVD